MVFAPVACRSVEAFIIGFSPRLLAKAGMTVSTPSTKAPGDIILGFLLCGVRKEFRRLPDLDQLPLEEERGLVADAPRLLHIVRHDDDRVHAFELVDEFLDLKGRDGVERRSRLVHEHNLWFDGQRAGAAQPLLLPTPPFSPPLPPPAFALPPPPTLTP